MRPKAATRRDEERRRGVRRRDSAGATTQSPAIPHRGTSRPAKLRDEQVVHASTASRSNQAGAFFTLRVRAVCCGSARRRPARLPSAARTHVGGRKVTQAAVGGVRHTKGIALLHLQAREHFLLGKTTPTELPILRTLSSRTIPQCSHMSYNIRPSLIHRVGSSKSALKSSLEPSLGDTSYRASG